MFEEEEKVKKKTPSARVIAAMVLIETFQDIGKKYDSALMTDLCDSRVSDDKKDKILVFVDKLTDKFRTRLEKIVEKYNHPPKKK